MDYVNVAKFMGGGVMSTYTNLSRGLGGLSREILSYTEPLHSQTFECYSSGELAVLKCFYNS